MKMKHYFCQTCGAPCAPSSCNELGCNNVSSFPAPFRVKNIERYLKFMLGINYVKVVSDIITEGGRTIYFVE